MHAWRHLVPHLLTEVISHLCNHLSRTLLCSQPSNKLYLDLAMLMLTLLTRPCCKDHVKISRSMPDVTQASHVLSMLPALPSGGSCCKRSRALRRKVCLTTCFLTLGAFLHQANNMTSWLWQALSVQLQARMLDYNLHEDVVILVHMQSGHSTSAAVDIGCTRAVKAC